MQGQNSRNQRQVESANRFVQWLEPYNGELESEEKLLELIKRFNEDVNREVIVQPEFHRLN